MRRIGLAVALIFSLTIAPLAVEAQPSGEVHRSGVLGAASPESSPHTDALRQGLRELGYLNSYSSGRSRARTPSDRTPS